MIKFKEKDKATIVYIGGKLDSCNASEIIKNVKKKISDNKYIIINLKDIDFIDSVGLSALLKIKNIVRNYWGYHVGSLKLSNLTPEVDRIFKAIKFNKIFEIYSTEDDALTSIPKNKIMIIDSDSDTLDVMEVSLEFYGFEVVKVSDSLKVFEIAKEERPNIITTAIDFPKKDGFQLIAEIKGCKETKNIPVVVISFKDERTKAFKLGATDYILKPFSFKKMLKLVEDILGQFS